MLSFSITIPLLPIFLFLRLLYRYLSRSALNAIPNAHPTAPFSSLWLLSIRFRKCENRTIRALHEHLGPIVRVAPNEVSVYVLSDVKTIFGGGWDKPVWYEAFMNYGVPNLVSSIHHAPHSVRKRMLSGIYSKSYLQTSSDLAALNSHILTQKFLPQIAKSAASDAPVDVLRLNTAWGMDVMSAYEFGSAYGTDFITDVDACNRFLIAFANVKDGFFFGGQLPAVVDALEQIGIYLTPKEAMDGQAEIEDMCWKMCERVQGASDEMKSPPASSAPVVYAQLESSLAKSGEKAVLSSDSVSLERRALASELLDHLIAGHETTGIALTYIMYELSMHPTFQTALRAELRTVDPPLSFPLPASVSPSALPRALDALPLLNAAIYETLRLYPPGAGAQSRVVPPEGATLSGYVLPAGVVAHASASTVHRNEEVFEQPDQWLPERWTGPRKKEVADWFWAFGSGPRGCIGKSFAMQETLVLIGAVYANYSSHIVDAEGIEQVDEFVAGPKAGKLILRFEKVE